MYEPQAKDYNFEKTRFSHEICGPDLDWSFIKAYLSCGQDFGSYIKLDITLATVREPTI